MGRPASGTVDKGEGKATASGPVPGGLSSDGSGQGDDRCNDGKKEQDFLDHVVAGLLDLHGWLYLVRS